MANRPYEFVSALLKAEHAIAPDLGTDVMSSDKQSYNINLLTLSLVAMTLKIVQDLHPDLVTDAALLDRLNTAIDTGPNGDRSGWPGWILLQVRPEQLARYGATETDTVPQLQAKIDAFNNALNVQGKKA
ncbi:hypothetical protein GCM10010172_06850 [Paractinoplanes ferrugineus]|uniref:Uncharacterized protein n=1 Tax=Paractinoplanes ferrugineus TaxID=113564 RepID=A0A919JAG5_9ACTN|nr:hypothetical protein [Actinoplanes ferrugineus]GIE16287.1 hypothetical protein Afe05nite_81270 [Actinoplanes ferrugineus]